MSSHFPFLSLYTKFEMNLFFEYFPILQLLPSSIFSRNLGTIPFSSERDAKTRSFQDWVWLPSQSSVSRWKKNFLCLLTEPKLNYKPGRKELDNARSAHRFLRVKKNPRNFPQVSRTKRSKWKIEFSSLVRINHNELASLIKEKNKYYPTPPQSRQQDFITSIASTNKKKTLAD